VYVYVCACLWVDINVVGGTKRDTTVVSRVYHVAQEKTLLDHSPRGLDVVVPDF